MVRTAARPAPSQRPWPMGPAGPGRPTGLRCARPARQPGQAGNAPTGSSRRGRRAPSRRLAAGTSRTETGGRNARRRHHPCPAVQAWAISSARRLRRPAAGSQRQSLAAVAAVWCAGYCRSHGAQVALAGERVTQANGSSEQIAGRQGREQVGPAKAQLSDRIAPDRPYVIGAAPRFDDGAHRHAGPAGSPRARSSTC